MSMVNERRIRAYPGWFDTQKVLTTFFPFTLIASLIITLLLLFNDSQISKVLPLLMLALLLSMGTIWGFLQRNLRQLKQLAVEADRIATGSFDSPVNTSRIHEIGDLASAIESMRCNLRYCSDELHRQRAINESTLNSIADGVITTDSGGMVTYMNNAAEQQTGWILPDVKGRAIENVFKEENLTTQQPLTGSASNDATTGYPSKVRQALLSTKGGEIHPVECRTTRIVAKNGRLLGTTLVFTDLSESSNLRTELVYQTSHDSLTDLINRREFERRLKLTIDSARLLDQEHALCYLDLDQFKVINDTCGHAAGDDLLCQMSSLFKNAIRVGDTLARLGGDEFGLLLEHCTAEQAERVTKQLLDVTRDFHFCWEDRSFSVGVSIGLVSINSSTSGIAAVLSDADSACYMAKDAGRNRMHVFHKNDAQLVERRGEMQWVDKINRALEKNDFVLYVQRIEPTNVSALDRQHFEVLVRMRDEAGDLVPPASFLPAAERYSLISKIDQWVVTNTLEWLTEHPKVISSLAVCSINLSGHSLGDATFLPFIMEQLDKYEVPTESLCFEITETATIANLTSAMLLMRTLKARGCQFALDDFGSGLSSFAYLKNLPVDYLKIDGQFVRDIMDDTLDFAMVRSINEIGQLMGMQTIAEFVENDAIKSRLRSLGVNFFQGYGVEKPKPMEQLLV